MSACKAFTVAVPVVSTGSSSVRGSCVRQRIGISGQAGFPSFQYMSCRSGNSSVTKQWWKQCAPKASRMTRIMASQEGVPQEILEDSKFVPINEDDPRFGPPAMILLGFGDNDVATALEMIKDMGGDFMQVLVCTDEMMNGTLNEALNTTQPDLSQVKAATGMPPICFLSGLSGEELMMVVRAFPEAGLIGTAFAAHVPKNSNKPLRELTEEIMGDHERLSKPQQPAQA
ncbi:hypothetical protein M758_2G104700 [Ceratodon purpureus]|nr:hypothetical protein M758_2G104700 [Ceratodon purpureus]